MRGTIVEKVSGSHVTILLVDGQTRRVEMADVSYAGPVGEMPARDTPKRDPPPPPPKSAPRLPVHEPSSGVRFWSNDDRTRGVFARSGTVGILDASGSRKGTAEIWSRLCATPCSVSLPSGRYELAIEGEDGKLADLGAVPIRSEGKYLVSYVDRSLYRGLGWVLIPTAVVTGLAMVSGGTGKECVDRDLLGTCTREEPTKSALVPIGWTVLVGGTLAGIVLVTRKDYATIEEVRQSRFGVRETTIRVGAGGLSASGTF